MSWYIEFEVEDEKAEDRFWRSLRILGRTAQAIESAEKTGNDYLVEEAKENCLTAAIDFAREMGYIS